MMKVLILLCATGMAHSDCRVDTAYAVINGPELESLMCPAMLSQAYIADTAFAQDLQNGTAFYKVKCCLEDRQCGKRQ